MFVQMNYATISGRRASTMRKCTFEKGTTKRAFYRNQWYLWCKLEKGTTKLHAPPLTTFTLFTPFVGTKFLFFYIFFYKKYLQIKIEITI